MKYIDKPDNAKLDKGIKDLRGITANALERAQVLAVGIIEHDIAHGDCSRAKDLVNVLHGQEQRRNMVQFLAYFGNIGIKMEKGVATGVGHIAETSKRYRKPNLEGAKANNWFEPYDGDGKRRDWFNGPEKPAYTPGTLGDVGQNVVNFAERMLGTDTRVGQLFAEKDNGRGEQVPVYDLTDDERQLAETTLKGLHQLGTMLMAREQVGVFAAKVKELQGFIAATDKVVDDINKLGKSEDEPAVDNNVTQSVAG